MMQSPISMGCYLAAHRPARTCFSFLLPNEIGEVREKLSLQPSNMTWIDLKALQDADEVRYSTIDRGLSLLRICDILAASEAPC